MKPSEGTFQTEGTNHRQTTGEKEGSGEIPRPHCRLALVLLLLNLISSALFVCWENRPIFDDSYNMFDVHAYATKGMSVSTIRAQKNAPGPTSFLWMAAGARLLGGDELRAARIAVLFSWVLLGGAMIAGGCLTRCPELWCGALLFTLVFPHSVMATATVLTEGPGLLFAAWGALAWTEFMSTTPIDLRAVILGVTGGLSLGVAATCRQYYIALLASALVIVLLRWSRARERNWLGSVALSLVGAAIPIVVLLLLWKGITSPSMAAGMSYSKYQAGPGLNIGRPVVACFCVLLYLLPLSFPAVVHLPSAQRLAALLAAVFGVLAVPFRSFLVQPGPVRSLIQAGSYLPAGATVVFGLLTGITAYNAVAVGLTLWRQRANVAACIPLQFALLTILFFVVEQSGVGGNIGFYDRYILQLAPFLGIILFWLFPKLTGSRIAVLIGLSALSQIMLWRFARW
jgi:hypothetical protein